MTRLWRIQNTKLVRVLCRWALSTTFSNIRDIETSSITIATVLLQRHRHVLHKLAHPSSTSSAATSSSPNVSQADSNSSSDSAPMHHPLQRTLQELLFELEPCTELQLQRAVALYSSLIQHGIFSHDSFAQFLISRGLLSSLHPVRRHSRIIYHITPLARLTRSGIATEIQMDTTTVRGTSHTCTRINARAQPTTNVIAWFFAQGSPNPSNASSWIDH